MLVHDKYKSRHNFPQQKEAHEHELRHIIQSKNRKVGQNEFPYERGTQKRHMETEGAPYKNRQRHHEKKRGEHI